MPPNFNDTPGPTSANFVDGPSKDKGSRSSSDTALKVSRTFSTLLAHFLIGIVCGACLLYAFRSGTTPLNTTNQHIVLCVLGFQFLMAEAILCLAPDNWLSNIGLKHKRWIHLVLQILGSVLAIYGCIIMSLSKTWANWDTPHGKWALVSMVFTTVSIVNGFSSHYAYELRRILPGSLSKLTHICFGVVAVATASVSLGYGFNKFSFRMWSTSAVADTLIVMTGTFTTIVIINPLIIFYRKLVAAFTS